MRKERLFFFDLSIICNSFVTSWTVAHQAPLWDFPGKNAGVGCHFLLQGIFPTQGSNPCLPQWQAGSLPLHCQGQHFYGILHRIHVGKGDKDSFLDQTRFMLPWTLQTSPTFWLLCPFLNYPILARIQLGQFRKHPHPPYLITTVV